MRQIFENNPKEDLIDKKVIKDLANYHFNIENISLIKVLNRTSCDVVAKDLKGYRSYLVNLEKSSKFTHFYKIFDVKGQKIISSYQWKNR